MTPILPTNISRDPHCLTWLFTNSAGARVSTRILCATSAQEHFADRRMCPLLDQTPIRMLPSWKH
jgi:hypothetical protein